MSKKFKELLKEEIIVKLEEAEKQNYCSFLDYTWQDNLEACKFNLLKFPRWSIIAGYYAMHDLTKLFLAKNFNLKITKRVHFVAIIALEEVLKDKEIKNKIIELLEQAEKYYSETEIFRYLGIAKREREKVQYYTGRKIDFKNYQIKASYFIDNIFEPFIKIFRQMVK